MNQSYSIFVARLAARWASLSCPSTAAPRTPAFTSSLATALSKYEKYQLYNNSPDLYCPGRKILRRTIGGFLQPRRHTLFLSFYRYLVCPHYNQIFMHYIKHQFQVLMSFLCLHFPVLLTQKKCYYISFLNLQDGEEVVYDMDIEILDSYPTIEILGSLRTYTSAQKQKANIFTIHSTDTVFEHWYNSILFVYVQYNRCTTKPRSLQINYF